jgi:hypothetical protein
VIDENEEIERERERREGTVVSLLKVQPSLLLYIEFPRAFALSSFLSRPFQLENEEKLSERWKQRKTKKIKQKPNQ